jgi:hypothetical protein
MRYAWLCHPVTIAGVIVLLVNDHLLKQAWPGFVTGKLSDVAGLVVAPALLALLLRRRADLAATVLTGVLFALVKTTETGAEAASQAWTLVAGPSRILADPTDLLALPALALAWWVRRRSLTSAPSARGRIVVTMPLAVLAVTATSAAPAQPSAVSAVSAEVKGERITVSASVGTVWVSEDRGATWSERTGPAPHERLDAGGSGETRPADVDGQTRPPQTDACVPYEATRCYRVVPGRMAVEQSDDGGKTWGPSWSLSEEDHERLVRRYDDAYEPRSTALTVQAWRGGHVVVVANGQDGILLRDAAGTWRRLGWPGRTESRPVDLGHEWTVALFLAGCMLFGGAGAGMRLHARLYMTFGAIACLGLYAAAGLRAGGPHPLLDLPVPFLLRPIGLLATVAGTVVCLVLLFVGKARRVPVAVGVLGAPMVCLSVYMPFYGWSAGTPGSYWVAVALAVLLTALVVLPGLALIRRDARRASAPADGRRTAF